MIATTIGPDDKGRFTPVMDLGDGFGKLYSARKYFTEDEAAAKARETALIVRSEFIRRGWRNAP